MLGLALALTVATTLVACGGGSDAKSVSGNSSTSGVDRPASFTDDLGTTIELPTDRPLRVAAQSVSAGGLWEYGIRPVAVFGPQITKEGKTSPAVGEADPKSWETVGDSLGTINLEALAEAEPDVIVTASWGEDNGLWGIDEAQVDEVSAIAPILAVRVAHRSLPKTLARYAEVAEALGADLSAKPVLAARQRFDDASAALRTAAEAQKDLRIGGVSGDAGHIYIAVPDAWPDLKFYKSLGVNLVEPKEHDEFWETLSWEESTKYPVDLVLADNRGGDVKSILEQFPASQRLVPAVAKGQIALWEMETPFGYSNFATVQRNLAKAIEAAAVIEP
jgi:iron complex transport system substrate-binding protein